jgi:hypothetical protein
MPRVTVFKTQPGAWTGTSRLGTSSFAYPDDQFAVPPPVFLGCASRFSLASVLTTEILLTPADAASTTRDRCDLLGPYPRNGEQ